MIFKKTIALIHIIPTIHWIFASVLTVIYNFIDFEYKITYLDSFKNIYLLLFAIAIFSTNIIMIVLSFNKNDFKKLRVFCYILLIASFIMLTLIPSRITEIPRYLIYVKLGIIDTYAVYFIMPLFSKIFFGLISVLWMILDLFKDKVVSKKLNYDN